MQDFQAKTSTLSSSKFPGLNKPDDENFLQWMEEQKILHEKMKQVCSKYGESVKIERSKKMLKKMPKKMRILYDPKTRLMFCRNSKVIGWFFLYPKRIKT